MSPHKAVEYGSEPLDVFEISNGCESVLFKGTPIHLDPECCTVLITLLQHRGTSVKEEDLLKVVNRHENESSQYLWEVVARLNTGLAACGEHAGYVCQFPGHGYMLQIPELGDVPLHLPGREHTVIGRAVSITRIRALLPLRRFVTIVGAGGVGKTTLMSALCATFEGAYRDGIHILDLAPLSDGNLLPTALAAALGITLANEGPFDALTAYLRGKRMLIVLDSCEHLIASAAVAAEAILSASIGMNLLATSREPLLASGESVYRLTPMSYPSSDVVLSAAQAKRYSSVQLLLERINRAPRAGTFEFTDSTAEVICEICRKLDGLPLALELAASLIGSIGAKQLLDELNMRLLAPSDSDRHVSTRHMSLAAMLDWSYDLLPEAEQRALRRLAIFRGSFTLEAALAVAAHDGMDAAHAMDCVLELIAKSFISVGGEENSLRHRLLDTTRAYSLAKLKGATDEEQAYRRHIEFLCKLFEDAEDEWERVSRSEWLTAYAPWVDDVRAALDRAFGPDGDKLLGVRLTVSCCALGNQPSLMSEFGARVDAALVELSKFSEPYHLWEVRLCCYRAHAQLSGTLDLEQMTATLEHYLSLARENGLVRYQTAPLCGLWAMCALSGEYPQAVEISHRLCDIGRECDDPTITLVGKRMLAQASQFMGWHNQSWECAQIALDESWRRVPLAHYSGSLEVSTSMRIMQARVLWQQGKPDSAADMGDEAMRFSLLDVPVALCQAISLAALPIAIWSRDLAKARTLLTMLLERVDRFGLVHWLVWADCFAAVLALLDGDDAPMRRLNGRNAAPPFTCQRDHMPTFSADLWSSEILDRINVGKVGWCAPEVLRLQGERMRESKSLDETAQAQKMLVRALELARKQDALGWELRCASSLASLLHSEGRSAEGIELLSGVLTQFTEGYGTADLIRAGSLLSKMQQN